MALSQSRAMSITGSFANVAIGFGVALLSQLIIFPLFGIKVSLAPIWCGAFSTGFM